jgi:hypothetical protein
MECADSSAYLRLNFRLDWEWEEEREDQRQQQQPLRRAAEAIWPS